MKRPATKRCSAKCEPINSNSWLPCESDGPGNIVHSVLDRARADRFGEPLERLFSTFNCSVFFRREFALRGSGKAAGAPPTGHMLGIGPSPENQAARGAQDAGEDEFLPGLSCGRATGCFGHAFSPWLVAHPYSRAGGRASSPKP